MAATAPQLQDEPETPASDLAGMFSFYIDPQGAAKCVNSKWFWVGPLIVFSIVAITAGILIMPIVQHAMETMPVPDNVPPEQFQKSMQIGMMIQKVFMYLAPITGAALFAIQALVLFGMSSVTSVKATFRQLFNLVAGCSMISLLESIAMVVILKAKGEVSSVAELRPALGLDIFLPEGTNKILVAVLGYFSVFQIWWIVMLALVFAAAFRVNKSKAFVVIAPLVLLGFLWRVVGAAFQR